MRRLDEVWVWDGVRMTAQGDAAEISRLLKDELEEVGVMDGGWRKLFRRPSDGALWELSYPQSEMHGGGPRSLTELDITDMADWR